MPTKQEIFDKVATHLFTQGKASQNEEKITCYYRGPNNTSCAVGCLIPDELYNEELEYHTWVHFKEAEGGDMESIYELLGGDETYQLLRDLQHVHDYNPNWATTLHLKSALQEVAAKHELDYSVLTDLVLLPPPIHDN